MSEQKESDAQEKGHRLVLTPGTKPNLTLQKERRLILNTEMEAVGLSSYELYLNRELIDIHEENIIMTSYLAGGSPNLVEVVRVLVTFTRKSMLKEVGCWNEEFIKYMAFAADTSAEFTNLNCIKSKIIQDKDRSNTSLTTKLGNDGFSNSSIEQSHTALKVRAAHALNQFIENGIGHVEKLASEIALASRYVEVNKIFYNSDVKLPFIHMDALFREGADDNTEVFKMKNENCDKRIISWLLGSDSTPIKELVYKLKAERTSRQNLVDAYVSAWRINFKSMPLYHSLVKDLEKFVLDNYGDIRTIIPLFVLDDEMEKSGLPSRKELIQRAPQQNEKFNNFRCVRREDVFSFIKQLEEERATRYAFFLKNLTDILVQPQGIQGPSLSITMKRNIGATNYVRLGTGLLSDAIQGEGILQKAINEATPSLSSSNLTDRRRYDSWCNGFIKSGNPMPAEDLAALWQVEESLRCKEIEDILFQKDNTTIGNLKSWKLPRHCKSVIKGTSNAYQLRKELTKNNIKKSYDKEIEDIIFQKDNTSIGNLKSWESVIQGTSNAYQLKKELTENHTNKNYDIVNLPDFKNLLEWLYTLQCCGHGFIIFNQEGNPLTKA